MKTITRQEFIDAVEAGITRADLSGCPLTEAEAIALRHVARTEPITVVGSFQMRESVSGRLCGCPLEASGIAWRDPEIDSERQVAQTEFYRGFDTALRRYNAVITVVD